MGWPAMGGSKIGTYDGNTHHQFPDAILAVEWPDIWRSSSTVSLPEERTDGGAYQGQFWEIQDGIDIGEVVL
jgi:hypothetical protein